MARQDFDQIVKEEFGFLINDFGFSLRKCEKISGGYDVLFTNQTTGVRIVYEFREAFLFVTIYKLKNGTFLENPRPMHPNSVLTGFSLDDIVTIRNPAAELKPAHHYGATSEFYDPDNGLRLFVRKFAENLRNYGSDMLRGDFRLFEKLDPIVKRRVLASS